MIDYFGTILITIGYVASALLLILCKDRIPWSGFLCVLTLFYGLLFFIVFSVEKRDTEYLYDLEYTVRLHYIDGCTQVKTFTCRGYETPMICGERGSFIFRLGDEEIPAVIRYDVVNKTQIQKKD